MFLIASGRFFIQSIVAFNVFHFAMTQVPNGYDRVSYQNNLFKDFKDNNRGDSYFK